VQDAKSIEIPGFVGLSTQAAEAAGQRAGLSVDVGSTRNAPDPEGIVIDQDPKGGAFSTDHRVSLVVSSGPAKVAVPNIVQTQWQAAKQALDAAGLTYDAKPATRYDPVARAGTVLSVTPAAGTLVLPDQKVTVVVSAGHAPVAVPDVTDDLFADASKTLTDAKFKVQRAPKDEFSNDVAAGNVIRTVPAAGTNAAYGSTVTVVVSKGPDKVAVPDLRNLSFDNASQALDSRGLSLQVNGSYRTGQLVSGQQPAPGTLVLRGSNVTVTFSRSNCLLDFICIP